MEAGRAAIQVCRYARIDPDTLEASDHWNYTAAHVAFRYIAIEGPIGVGKTRLAERLAGRLDAHTVLEEAENPFLADFYNERPGAALQAQLFYLLNRHRQLTAIRQAESCTVRDVAQQDVTLRYVPDQRTGEAVLACATGSVVLDADEVMLLHDTLRAHMPDRMRPLPV